MILISHSGGTAVFCALHPSKSVTCHPTNCEKTLHLLQYAYLNKGRFPMKYTIQKIPKGEDEVILRYQTMTPEVERVYYFLNGMEQKLIGWNEKTQVVLELSQILYIESVDGKTFAYTEKEVLRMDHSLNRLETILSDINFFRCSKSMIINIDKVERLKSLPSNRIDAVMRNGEHILISRTYASDFRKRLRGGRENE